MAFVPGNCIGKRKLIVTYKLLLLLQQQCMQVRLLMLLGSDVIISIKPEAIVHAVDMSSRDAEMLLDLRWRERKIVRHAVARSCLLIQVREKKHDAVIKHSMTIECTGSRVEARTRSKPIAYL